MKWRRRLRQWIFALKLAGAKNVPWLGLLRAVLSGPVPRRVWRARLRFGCFKCPLWSSVQMPGTTKGADRVPLCHSTHPAMAGAGCRCYLPFLALAARPYPKGCIGQSIAPDLGWPPYYWPSRWARLRSVLDFLMGR